MHELNQPFVRAGGLTITPPPAPATLAGERPSVVERRWLPTPFSVGRVRECLARHLDAWGLAQLADSAEVVVSELVTNAVTHACTPNGALISTRFERLASGVRIEVRDCGDSEPERRDVSEEDESGRGLTLVAALTGGQWGVDDWDGPGKLVWAVCAEDGAEVSG